MPKAKTKANPSTRLRIAGESFDSLRSLRANAEPVEAEQSRTTKRAMFKRVNLTLFFCLITTLTLWALALAGADEFGIEVLQGLPSTQDIGFRVTDPAGNITAGKFNVIGNGVRIDLNGQKTWVSFADINAGLKNANVNVTIWAVIGDTYYSAHYNRNSGKFGGLTSKPANETPKPPSPSPTSPPPPAPVPPPPSPSPPSPARTPAAPTVTTPSPAVTSAPNVSKTVSIPSPPVVTVTPPPAIVSSPPPADTTAPTGTIKINNDTSYTNSLSVSLNLSAQDNSGGSGLSQMRFSNDNSTWSNPESYATTKNWSLTSGDGTKTGYVKYKDNAGNWSQAYSDTIILDTTPLVITITSPTNGQVIEEPQIQLSGTIDGIAFSESRSLIEGENTLTQTATDLAGNTSSSSITVSYSPGPSQLITQAGGEITSSDGKVKVIIPQGALAEPKRIKISTLNKETLANVLPNGTTLLIVAEFKPLGLSFNKPVSIIYSLEQAEIPGTPIELGLYDSLQNKIISTGQISTVPIDGYTLSFSITHFSTYAALKSFTTQGTPIGSGVKIPLPDMLTGSFGHSIPITIPPGRKGLQPNIALSYRSANPNSWLGLGFSLNPGYIVRSTRLGPPTYKPEGYGLASDSQSHNDTKDTFYFITDAGTTELVHLIDNLYQAKVESSFTKFFKESDDSWRVVGKEGGTLRFGQTGDSKETSNSGTFSWYLTKAIDTNGNYIEYHYTKDQGKSYLSHIDYTGNEIGVSPTNTVEFFLESRDDVTSSYISTSKITTAKRLREIQLKVNSTLVWRYTLEYAYSPDTNRSLLKSITQYASDNKNLPQQSFSYQKAR